MAIQSTLNRTVEIIRPIDSIDNGEGTDFTFDQESNKTTIKSDYRCRIDENIRYSTGQEGSQYQGSVKMVGTLTEVLQEGDIVDSKYKILGSPEVGYKQRATICQMVRL